MANRIEGFALRLTKKMAERGVSQADLCRLTGLASSMVSHYCTGQRTPSIAAAIKIAKALNTTVDQLALHNPLQLNEGYDESHIANATSALSETIPPTYDFVNDEQSLVSKFRSLNTQGQKKVIAYIKDLLATGRYSQ